MNRLLDDGFITSHDLDWYAQDGKMIAHFATGGTDSLPFSVINNKTDWEYICDFINNLPSIQNGLIAICHDNLPDFKNEQDKDNYLSSFIQMAKKGLLSYDIDFNTLNYKLIAYPVTTHLKVSQDICNMLPEIKLRKIILQENIKQA